PEDVRREVAVLRERAVRAHHEVDAEPALLQDRDGRVDAARDGLVDDELDRASSFALRGEPVDAVLGERADREAFDRAHGLAADDEAAAHWLGSLPWSSSTARTGSFSPVSKKRALTSVAIGLVTICAALPTRGSTTRPFFTSCECSSSTIRR